MRCDAAQRALQDAPGRSPELQVHLDGCAQCQALLALDSLLYEPGLEPPMPETLVPHIMAAVQAGPQRVARGWDAGLAAGVVVACLVLAATYVSVDVLSTWAALATYLQSALAGFSVLGESLVLSLPFSTEAHVPMSQAGVALLLTVAGLVYLNVRSARVIWR